MDSGTKPSPGPSVPARSALPAGLAASTSGVGGMSWAALCLSGSAGMLELWRRVKMEFTVELPMLKQRWKILVFGLVMQYVHGIFTQLAHRMHQPQPQPLHDVGFSLTPELGPDKFWISEAIFGTLFIMFIFWTFTPFLTARKRFYTVVMWSRLLMVLVVCQALRILSFSSTQLPGPGFHCRSDQESATREWPDHWTGHVTMNVARQASKSCGDLIFSSHTTFMLTGIMAYNQFGNFRLMKYVAWTGGAIVSCLIIASRKHYTVDIVIAWYTVPLVFYTMYRRWTTTRPVTSEFLGAIGETDEPMILDEGDDGGSDVEAAALLAESKGRPGSKSSMEMAGMSLGGRAGGLPGGGGGGAASAHGGWMSLFQGAMGRNGSAASLQEKEHGSGSGSGTSKADREAP